jgi:Protein of unknown function (DUF2950)
MTRVARLTLGVALVVIFLSPARAAQGPKVFSTPEDAAQALVEACERHDTGALADILGPSASELINSGDPVQDKARLDRFVRRAKEGLHVEPDPFHAGRLVMNVGKDRWPAPVPIVKTAGGYRFDVDAAKSEILARRVGRNELNAIAALRDFVEAELEFAYSDSNKNGIHDYAQQILSDPGQQNGLYWEVKDGEPPSPLARVVGQVAAEGYELPKPGEPVMYRGYAFRVLTGQGRHVTVGDRDYLVRGLMIGGFAFVAYPVEYGVSGVKTFVVNHEGAVWEKDLGPRTTAIASAIRRYNPDPTWKLSPHGASEVPRAPAPRP